LLDGGDLSTSISPATGAASFGEDGRPLYQNRRQVPVLIIALSFDSSLRYQVTTLGKFL